MVRIGAAAFLNNVFRAIYNVAPRTSVPMIIARKVKNARSFNIQRYIVVVGELIKEMTRIGPFIAAPTVVGAAHIGPRADALIRPPIPLPIGIQADRNDRRFRLRAPGAP